MLPISSWRVELLMLFKNGALPKHVLDLNNSHYMQAHGTEGGSDKATAYSGMCRQVQILVKSHVLMHILFEKRGFPMMEGPFYNAHINVIV